MNCGISCQPATYFDQESTAISASASETIRIACGSESPSCTTAPHPTSSAPPGSSTCNRHLSSSRSASFPKTSRHRSTPHLLLGNPTKCGCTTMFLSRPDQESGNSSFGNHSQDGAKSPRPFGVSSSPTRSPRQITFAPRGADPSQNSTPGQRRSKSTMRSAVGTLASG